jgi:nitrogen fixation NifU-like protein
MSDLRDLYQEVILDHSKRPRNFRVPEDRTAEAKGHNPLCGDRVTVYLKLVDGQVADVAFQGDGCAISKASASLMTEAVRGRSAAEARRLFALFHEVCTTGADVADEELDKLAVFAGVRDYPVRVKCATLPWHTLVAALDGAADPVKTE